MCYDATLITYVHAYIVYDIIYDIVRLTYDIVRQNTVLASRTCDIVYDVVYEIVRFFYDIVRTSDRHEHAFPVTDSSGRTLPHNVYH